MEKEPFYVTTPIYYVNDKPHIGHAYTTVLADVLARYHRLAGHDVWFLTGTDEHGQKVQKAADKNHMTALEQCDATVVRFQELWKTLQITHDDFIRTTEPRHQKIVQQVLQDLFERDLIYKAEYEGCYCVPCERFFTEKDLLEGKLCPDCKRPTESIIESNYFFRMSRYQDWLRDYIETHPNFIQPSFRANETLGFLKKPLSDLCISRPKSRLSWGIELPFDPDYVCYVWFDALINYVSAIGYGVNQAQFERHWGGAIHLIGKDILTTHTVYWPTMLKAMNVDMPQSIFAHGWWLVGQDKMGKSVGNAVNPLDMCEKYGVDAFRYFLMAEMSLGQDAAFSENGFISRYNAELANDLGNLLSRIVKMIGKQFNGMIPASGAMDPLDEELQSEVNLAIDRMMESVEQMKLDRGLEHVFNAVRACNRYLEKTAPWTLAKNGQTERLGTVLHTGAEALRILSGLLYPVMPQKMMELRTCLGLKDAPIELTRLKQWNLLAPGTQINDNGALFMRIELPTTSLEKTEKNGKNNSEKKKEAVISKSELPGVVTTIEIAEFAKVSLKTARIISAERIEGANKLLKLQVQLGTEIRQVVAGIAEFYEPEAIIGKLVILVANLKPAKIRGVDSYGMLLAAKNDKNLKLLTVDDPAFADGISVG